MDAAKENKNLTILSFVGCWLLYAVMHVILKKNAPYWNGILSAISIILLNVAGFY
jgi:hypothetical protein